jgi:hypothetical protein
MQFYGPLLSHDKLLDLFGVSRQVGADHPFLFNILRSACYRKVNAKLGNVVGGQCES